MRRTFFAVIIFTCVTSLYAELRTFNDVFPNIGKYKVPVSVFYGTGYIKSSRKDSGFIIIGGKDSCLDSQIQKNIFKGDPGYIVESIAVVKKGSVPVDLLDIYNAISNVRDLKGRLYNSATRNKEVPLFEEASRIASEKQTTDVDDPPPANILPPSETVYIRLRDANFGNTYYRGEMTIIQNGLSYNLSNFKSMTYMLIPIIKEEKFIAQLYFEPIKEGVLIYSIASAEISDFFASKIHIESAISKRLAVITAWASDGIINGNK